MCYFKNDAVCSSSNSRKGTFLSFVLTVYSRTYWKFFSSCSWMQSCYSLWKIHAEMHAISNRKIGKHNFLCGHLLATTKPLYCHKIVPSFCSLPLVGASGCPQETGNSDPGPRQEESELLATSSISQREEIHPTLIQTSEDILVLPSVCTSKCCGVLPTGQRAAVGATPIGTSRGWCEGSSSAHLWCMEAMSSSCLSAASGLGESLNSAYTELYAAMLLNF